MTSNIFDPKLGDLGNAASVAPPVENRAVVMEEQQEVSQAQDTAQDFNNLTNSLFQIAPVVIDMAAKKYVQKNLIGTDGAADVAGATDSEKVAEQQRSDVDGLVRVQQSLAVDEIKTFSGLEEARRQGSITFDEMQLRAATQRAESIQRAPLFASQIDAAYRSVVGTSTGTSSMGEVDLWNRTPEEEALQEDRKITALYAQKYNVDLETADNMRAEDAWVGRKVEKQPKNDAEFQNWGNSQVLKSTVAMQRNIAQSVAPDGTFSLEDQGRLRMELAAWESESLLNVQLQVDALRADGIMPSAELQRDMRDQINKQKNEMVDLLSDNDAISYWQGVNNISSAKVALTAKAMYPAQVLAKEVGVDLVDLYERLASNPLFSAYINENPAAQEIMGLTDMSAEDMQFSSFAKAALKLTGQPTATPAGAPPGIPVEPIKMDEATALDLGAMINSSPDVAEVLVNMAIDSGNAQQVADTFSLDPSAVVALKDTSLWDVQPSEEDMDAMLYGAASGVESLILSSKKRGGKSEYSVWVGEDGLVRMEGDGATSKAKGMAQDLYDTILANPTSWAGKFDSPSMYMQSMFEQRKFTVDNQVSSAVKALEALPAADLVPTIKGNLGAYITKIEDVEAAGEMLNQRLMTLPPTFDAMTERNEIIQLQNKLWDDWNNGDPILEPVDKEIEELLPFMRKVSSNTDEETMNSMLSKAGMKWDATTQSLSRIKS